MNIDLVGLFVPLSFFALIVLVVFFTSKYNYQTKKAILEHGGNIETKKKKFPVWEIGLTTIGLGVGLAVSVLPQMSDLPEEPKGLLVTACILLFGGLGLISSIFIKKRFEKKE